VDGLDPPAALSKLFGLSCLNMKSIKCILRFQNFPLYRSKMIRPPLNFVVVNSRLTLNLRPESPEAAIHRRRHILMTFIFRIVIYAVQKLALRQRGRTNSSASNRKAYSAQQCLSIASSRQKP
jgi:hypothetical protein